MPDDSNQNENWLVAKVCLPRTMAHKVLGLPHYIETDRFVDQQGLEDHWIITYSESVKIHGVYRSKTETLDLFADPPDLEFIKERFGLLFKDFELELIEPPVLFPKP